MNRNKIKKLFEPTRKSYLGTNEHVLDNLLSRILRTEKDNIIRLYPLFETSGNTAEDLSNNSEDGTYVSVTLNNQSGIEGKPSPLFDGVNDYVDCDTNINTDFNSSRGSVVIAFRIIDPSLWSENLARNCFMIRFDSSNVMRIFKTAVVASNQIRLLIEGQGNQENFNHNFATATTDWHIAGFTWNSVSGVVEYFMDGVNIGSDAGYLAWANPPTTFKIGAIYTGNANFWKGSLGYMALWNTDLSVNRMLKVTKI